MKKFRRIDYVSPKAFNAQKLTNPLFSSSKIYVMYHGLNRNGSNISKASVENALETLKNVPIVGEFVEEDKNFAGHGGKLEITEDDIKFVQTTKPIGVIPESAKFSWETVKDFKDREKEYLVIEGALMWNRYEEEVRALKEDNFGQSMEIEVFDAGWSDELDAYDITSFAFSGLCILGIDKNGTGHVEPAFEDAKVITYSQDQSRFRQEFAQMLSELNSTEQPNEPSKEEQTMKLQALLEKYSLTIDDLNEKEIKFSEMSLEELEQKIIEVFEIKEDQEPEAEPETEPEAVQPESTEPVATEPETPVAEPEVEPEAVQTDVEPEPEVTPDQEPEAEPEQDPVDYSAQVVELEADLATAKSELQTLTAEVEELREFKLQVEKSEHETSAKELFNKFQLTDEDVKEVEIHSLTIKELENKAYEIFGRKHLQFSADEEQPTRIQKINKDKDQKDKPYGDLFDVYN